MVRSPSAAKDPPCAAFQSQPTDLDLVNTYLRPWVEKRAKVASFIHNFDPYGADPAVLTRDFTPAVSQDGERAWYFFTSLRQKSVHGKRKMRSVANGTGCWHNEAKSKPVYMGINGRRQIGHRQSFSFVKKQGNTRVRSGWLMIELRLLIKDRAGQEVTEESALGNIALCKVYRSPRNPEPAGGEPAAEAALPGPKAEADDDDDDDESGPATESKAEADDDDESGPATESDDRGDTSDASPKGKSDEEVSSDATVVAPSRHSKTEVEISGPAAAGGAGRVDKASGREDSAEVSAAAPALKRKLSDDENFGAAAPARKRKANGDSSPRAAAPATEMHCPQCGTHLVVTMVMKPETEVAKDAPVAPDAAPPRRFHEWL